MSNPTDPTPPITTPLEACPFCGGEVRLIHEGEHYSAIRCNDCSADTTLHALADWNRRIAPAPAPVEVAELVERINWLVTEDRNRTAWIPAQACEALLDCRAALSRPQPVLAPIEVTDGAKHEGDLMDALTAANLPTNFSMRRAADVGYKLALSRQQPAVATTHEQAASMAFERSRRSGKPETVAVATPVRQPQADREETKT